MSVNIEKEHIRAIVKEVLREEGFTPADIMERIIRLEEGQKTIIETMNVRFEAVDKRFDAILTYMNKRFEDVNKRFEDVNKRFDDVNKRFDDVGNRFLMLTALMTIGFIALGILIRIF
ncbi:MAG: hypothetical protein AB1742_00055 [bacterium]